MSKYNLNLTWLGFLYECVHSYEFYYNFYYSVKKTRKNKVHVVGCKRFITNLLNVKKQNGTWRRVEIVESVGGGDQLVISKQQRAGDPII